MKETLEILTGQRPGVTAGVNTVEQNDAKYVRADGTQVNFSPYSLVGTYTYTIEGQPYKASSGIAFPLRLYASRGNVQLLIETGSNTATDYPAIQFKQGGVQQGGIYTNQSGLYFSTGGAARLLMDSIGDIYAQPAGAFTGSPITSKVAGFAFRGTSGWDMNNPSGTLMNWGMGVTGSLAVFYYTGGASTAGVGSIGITTTSTSYNTTSDYRLKENLVPLTNALARNAAIPKYRFDWIADNPDHPVVDGFLAHEVQAVVPEAVTGTKDAVDANGNPVYQQIDQSKLVPLLSAAIDELSAQLQALTAQFNAYVAAHP
jgi:hypothetical protein